MVDGYTMGALLLRKEAEAMFDIIKHTDEMVEWLLAADLLIVGGVTFAGFCIAVTVVAVVGFSVERRQKRRNK